jgi:hypothetical protein
MHTEDRTMMEIAVSKNGFGDLNMYSLLPPPRGWKIRLNPALRFEKECRVKHIVDAGGQFRSVAEPLGGYRPSTGRLMIAVWGLADVNAT